MNAKSAIQHVLPLLDMCARDFAKRAREILQSKDQHAVVTLAACSGTATTAMPGSFSRSICLYWRREIVLIPRISATGPSP